jgi:acyl-CoA synthetase (AMP-forming)/AMP-acid ligase II
VSASGRTILTKGYHSSELFASVRRAWEHDDDLLVVAPPLKTDFGFMDFLPGGSRAGSFPEKPIFGVFTSGTTSGRPRLVLYSRRNIDTALHSVLSLFDRSRITSIFAYPQPFHTFGLTLGYLLSLKLGVPLHFHEGKYSQAAHTKRASFEDPGLVTLGTPAHFYDLCSLIKKGLKVAPSYSCIIGGASVDQALWKDVRETALIEAPSIGYGCTEASPAITHLPPGQEPATSGEIGFPLENLHTRILPGEGVEISGPSLCLAIVDQGGITFPKKLIISDNIETRVNGSWVFHGRLDLLMNRGGSKIALEEVEAVLKQDLDIFAVAFAVPSERLGQELAIAISTESHAQKAAIHSVVQERFGVRLPPENVFAVEKFPLSESAKIDRAAVATMLGSQT